MIAEYKCKCGHEWKTQVEGGTLPAKHSHQHSSNCPNCESIYFKWTNYKK